MKKVLFAMMAMLAMTLTSCMHETGSGAVEIGIASEENTTDFDLTTLSGSYTRIIDQCAKEFDKDGWSTMSQTFNHTMMAMHQQGMTLSETGRSVKSKVDKAVKDYDARMKSDGGVLLKTFKLRVRYAIGTTKTENGKIYDVDVNMYKFED